MHLEMDAIVVETVPLLKSIDKMACKKRLHVILKDVIVVCGRQRVGKRYDMDSIELGDLIAAGKDLCVPVDDAPALRIGIDGLNVKRHS